MYVYSLCRKFEYSYLNFEFYLFLYLSLIFYNFFTFFYKLDFRFYLNIVLFELEIRTSNIRRSEQ